MTQRLADVAREIEAVAPLEYAESWDNVGLLVEAGGRSAVRRILLTIDLTAAVLAEAVAQRAQLIVAYHPPIFAPLKRLRASVPKEAIVLECARRGIAVHSPHTALDAAPGGVNDWLAGAFGAAVVAPIEPREALPRGEEMKLVVFVPRAHVDSLRGALAELGAGAIGDYRECSFELEGKGTFRGLAGTDPAVGASGRFERVDEVRLEMVCAARDVGRLGDALRAVHPYEEPAWELHPLAPRRSTTTGQGRRLGLAKAISLDAAVRRVKKRTGLSRLRVAASERHEAGEPIGSVSLCAGAGGSVLAGEGSDLLLTGEMRHHDVLEAVENGRSVILCDHTNTERGYLPVLAEQLRVRLDAKTEIAVSSVDRDPLAVR